MGLKGIFSTAVDFIGNAFNGSRQKNEALNALTQQNAVLQAQLNAQQQKQASAFNMASLLPIAAIGAICVVIGLIFKK